MTRTPGASELAPQYDVDNLSLAIQKLELAVIRSLESMEVRMKGLESRIDNFQSYYGDLEMKRNADVSALVNTVVGITNNLTGLLNDVILQKNNAVMQATKQEFAAPAMVPPAMSMYRAPVQIPQPQSIFPQQMAQPMAQPVVPSIVPKPAPPVATAPVQQVVQSPVLTGVSTAPAAPAPVAPQVATPKKEEKPVLGFGDKFAKKPGEWDCQGCYNRNQAEHEKCPSCGTTKDGKQPATPESKPLISKLPEVKPTSQPISFGFQAPKTTTATPTTTAAAPATTTSGSAITFSFKPPVTKTETPVSSIFGQNTTSPFAAKTGTPTTGTTSMFGGGVKGATTLFGGSAAKPFSQNTSGISFGSLANQPSFLDKSAQDSNNAASDSFGAKSSTTFKKEDGEGHETESPEEFVPDAHFEPVVPLPDKVDVVTGEENEKTVYESRAKLYVFADKAVKERGTGVLKILHDPEKKSYRCVMRRDQVFKICANFKIYPNMTVEDKPGRDNVGIFHCVDFSEDAANGVNSVFLIKFDNGAEYNNFKKKFAESSKASGTDPGRVGSSNETQSESKGSFLPSISSHSQDDEAEDADYYEDEDYGPEDEEETRVVHEAPCTVILSDAYTSPMARNAGKPDTLKNVQLVVSTPDDDSFRIAFEKNEEEEHFPHYIDKTFAFTLNGKSLKYTARNADTGIRKQISCEFPNVEIAKKTLEWLEEFKNTTTYDGTDE